ncbi:MULTISPECIES: prolyl aminopeptidase [Hyphomonas]|uniref:prolyl aminopeptidase n=1 Tax=Hyphomonas TaxID=85 RepID=UPI000B74FBF4|nr:MULTISPECIES: prolyl aminopeptidase [Hyphomonas]MAH91770.1 prolyl aminopeptidase [Hyphomonas sp.]OUX89859.1 MAG: prolyl aminopeptidase [Hyphomonas sp. TMED31]HBF90337.1 prolyl aminopeptidase [Hyphomonas atlantica]
MNRRSNRRILYPRLESRRSGRLRVSEIHEIYWEESGNPNGIPVIAVHGGPGGGSSPEMRRFFDPGKYRIILFDQRGCGRSTPHSELRENTTWDLIDDMESIRDALGVDRWLVFGGSWGSTLSLAYGVTHPDRTLGLVLRGIFLVSKAEIQWFYQSGASRLFPDAYDRYIKPIPEDERDDLLMAFHKRLIGDDKQARIDAARAWSRWEGETLSIKGPTTTPARFNEDDFVDAFARIECHYFVNRGFFASDNWLLEEARTKLKDVPGVIVHGRYDVVTPLSTAWALSKAWPKADIHIIPDAGHSSMEPGIVDKLIQATDDFAIQYADLIKA